MVLTAWLVGNKDIFEVLGIVGGLLFTGLSLRIDARVRRAETLIEITKQHRELWMYFDEHPKLARLFDKNRDMAVHPLADEEVRFANFLFLHLRGSFGAKAARINVLPEHVEDDWREIFTHPAVTAAWDRMKHLHDHRFVALVERYRKTLPGY
ncbi:MAG TPA: hypothetical protein VG710_13695 [Opitutus sp.]|nr:hypothetical protein [Opitutus sp.]